MTPSRGGPGRRAEPVGGAAWAKLHGNVTSQLMRAARAATASAATLPMSAVRNLAYDPDRDVRRRAYEAELAAWERAAVPLAAALNGIKGEVNTLATPARLGLAARRRRSSTTTSTAQTLDAMHGRPPASPSPTSGATCGPRPARSGWTRLAWYDLFAPVGASTRAWTLRRGERLHRRAVRRLLDRAWRDFAERAFAERWIDAEPRAGKRDGAFCMRAARRRVAHPGQLQAGLRRRQHPRPRAGPRLPQPATWPAARRSSATRR